MNSWPTSPVKEFLRKGFTLPLESLSASSPEGALRKAAGHSSGSTSPAAFKLFLSLWPESPCAESPLAARSSWHCPTQAPLTASFASLSLASVVFLGNVPRTPQNCWNLATWQGSCRYRQRQTNLFSASLAMVKPKGFFYPESISRARCSRYAVNTSACKAALNNGRLYCTAHSFTILESSNHKRHW